jgi:hypothetical protein
VHREEIHSADDEGGRGGLDSAAGVAGEVSEFDLLVEKGEAAFKVRP